MTKEQFRSHLQELANKIYDDTRVTIQIDPYVRKGVWYFELAANKMIVPLHFDSYSVELFADEVLSSMLKQAIEGCGIGSPES